MNSEQIKEKLEKQIKGQEPLTKAVIENYIKDNGYVKPGIYKVSFDKMVELVYGYPKWLGRDV